MARMPKPAPTPLPAPRGRRPKTAGTPAEPAVAGGGSALIAQTAAADADAFTGRPASGQRGKPSRQQSKTAISSVFQSDPGKQLVTEVDPLEAAGGPAPAVDDALIAETTEPLGAGKSSAAGPNTGTPAKPAAQWDPATDTIRFDWAEIERTASREGPNQAMAKLLVAARAEGARSRWPF